MPRMDILKALQKGFSLVELLITFGIIALIVTFTVPQLFQSNTSTYSSKKTSAARDATFMILSAYRQYKSVNGSVPITMTPLTLSPYMSYLSVDTSSNLDDMSNWGSFVSCSVAAPCLRLSNGGKLVLFPKQLNGTYTTNATYFYFDPDGVYSGAGAVDNQSRSLGIILYYDGTIRTRGALKNNTCIQASGCGINGNSIYDPSWFTGF